MAAICEVSGRCDKRVTFAAANVSAAIQPITLTIV